MRRSPQSDLVGPTIAVISVYCAQLTMAGETCTFSSGGTTVSAFCEVSCCSTGCCGSTESDTPLIAIIIACVIAGLVLILIIAFCIYFWLRRKDESQTDKNKEYKNEKAKDKKSARKTKKGHSNKPPTITTITETDLSNQPKEVASLPKVEEIPAPHFETVTVASVAPVSTEVVQTVPKKLPQPKLTGRRIYAVNTKATQTGVSRSQPGDNVLWSKGRWESSSEHDAIPTRPKMDAFLYDTCDVAVGTEESDFPSTPVDPTGKSRNNQVTKGAQSEKHKKKKKVVNNSRHLTQSQIQSARENIPNRSNERGSLPTPIFSSTPVRSTLSKWSDSTDDFTRGTSVFSLETQEKGGVSRAGAVSPLRVTSDRSVGSDSRLYDPARVERDRAKREGYVATWQIEAPARPLTRQASEGQTTADKHRKRSFIFIKSKKN